MTDEESAATSPVRAKPGEGTDNDGKGDDGGEKGDTNRESKERETNTEVEEVDLDKLKAMPVRDLLVWARERKIDVKGAVKKDDILRNIENALSDNG
jgi:hypothetical protein